MLSRVFRGILRPLRRFDGPLERVFLAEYHEAARRWAGYAAIAALGLYLGVLAIVWFTEPHHPVLIWVRLGIIAVMALLAVLFFGCPGFSRRYYVWIAACGSCIGLFGIIGLFVLAGRTQAEQVITATPSFIFGVLLHYSFLRLPLRVAAAVGWSLSALALPLVPMASGGSELLRTALFLVFANIYGMVLCRLGEARERELFAQRGELEQARSDARIKQLEAEEADQQKTRLIAALSHDLRQPMTAAVAYIDILHSRLASNDHSGAIATAERAQFALTTLGATLEHLLTAARYDSGTEALHLDHVDLVAVLKDVYESYLPEAEKRSVALRFRLSVESLVLLTDQRSLRRILGNFLSNAIKFSEHRPGRESGVLVAARMRGERCRIDVIDCGIGIDSASQEEIWKPYVQLNNVERDRARGLGLGLFLVRRIVEQLPGHSIELASRPGRGSRFSLYVPAYRVRAEAGQAPARPEVVALPRIDLSPLQGAYVLLLEDDRDARLSISMLMGEWGVLTVAEATLAQLLRAHDESDRMVDAIVCDYRLGGSMNGLSAIDEIRSRLGYSPFAILVTGEPDIAPLRARAGPDTTVLHKPFAPEALAAPLVAAVRSARLREEG